MREPEFTIEDSILEENSRYLESLEMPLPRRTFLILFFLTLGAAGAVFLRLTALTWIHGDWYQNRALLNIGKETILPARRGIIYDRFGKPLVANEPAFSLELNLPLFKKSGQNLQDAAEKISEVIYADPQELLQLIKEINLEKTSAITLAKNLASDQMVRIRTLGIEGLEIHDDYRRNYFHGPAFSHILGYTGLPRLKDGTGKDGLEKAYDEFLSGADGRKITYRDAQGETLGEKLLSQPQNGLDLYTTIDSDFQKFFYQTLKNKLQQLGRTVGVGLAMDPRNGEILALVNLPSYDNNLFTRSGNQSERQAVLSNQYYPLFNRAISGTYAPGSTIKPLVALAALRENVIDPKKQIFSAGFIEIPNPYFPEQPSIFYDWKPNGWVDLYSAIAKSSNIYFYAVGGGYQDQKGIGIEKLKEYWQEFGFGEKTGIDLDGEKIGLLPDPTWKKNMRNDIWRLGDTYNVAIGQGDLQITPIQLLNYIAAIANNGKFYRPHIASSENIIITPQLTKDISNFGYSWQEVQKAMQDAVTQPYGSAHILADLPTSVAAKTGSAQTANNTRINAFLVGYAPAENPQIAILVLIENAKEGSLNAIPVAKEVLNWYYWNRLVKS